MPVREFILGLNHNADMHWSNIQEQDRGWRGKYNMLDLSCPEPIPRQFLRDSYDIVGTVCALCEPFRRWLKRLNIWNE